MKTFSVLLSVCLFVSLFTLLIRGEAKMYLSYLKDKGKERNKSVVL